MTLAGKGQVFTTTTTETAHFLHEGQTATEEAALVVASGTEWETWVAQPALRPNLVSRSPKDTTPTHIDCNTFVNFNI